MKVTIMQPAYLPWLGFFDRIANSDLLVLLDDVSMDMSSKTKFTNRNKIRTQDGWCWLTIPVNTKGKHGNAIINELEIINDSNWRQKHLRSLETNYVQASHFKEHIDFFNNLYVQEWKYLIDIIDEVFLYFMQTLTIKTDFVKSSALDVTGSKNDLILNICKYCGATKYISGPFGREYLDKEAFAMEDIELIFHDYKHPEYKQVYDGFIPYMSTVDLIFNYGNRSLGILKSETNDNNG